jgi:outer membrane protein assembly factor BamB
MDGEIYVGGAVDGDGSVFCPTLGKFNAGLNTLRWSYKTDSCTTAINSGVSYAVDILYADFLNDRVYGLMVPRNYDGTLSA